MKTLPYALLTAALALTPWRATAADLRLAYDVDAKTLRQVAPDTLLTFDDSRPVACRTAVRLTRTEVAPLPGVEDCKAFEALALEDGAIWSVIPNERNVEDSHVYAHTGTGGGESWLDLGPATAGTLTWMRPSCIGSMLFSTCPRYLAK